MNLLAGLIGLPFIASPVIYLSGHRPAHSKWKTERILSLVMLAFLWFGLLLVMTNVEITSARTYQLGVISLRLDGVSLLISTLAILLLTLVVIFSLHEIDQEEGAEKYYTLLFILTGMVMGLVCAGDLFNLWVWFEGTAIASYLLVAFYSEQPDALAACIKYFIQTAVGSVLVLFGIALVLMNNGTLDFDTMSVTPSPLLVVAGALFLIGFGVKAALFPNFTWLPDAYAESPAGISAYLSGVVTVTGIIALLKGLSVCIWSVEGWGVLLLIVAMLNILIGNILAVAQTQIKRILAYSSISHMGFILLAVGIGLFTPSAFALRASMLHLFIHGLMKSLAFLVVGAFAFGYGGSRPLAVDDLRGAAKHYPLLAFALIVALLSLTGIPLLAGFVSKWQIFLAGVQSGSLFVIALVIFAALNSIFALAYYLPIINALNHKAVNQRWQHGYPIPLTMRFTMIFLAIALIVLGIFPGLLNWLVDPAAETLLNQILVLGR